MGYGSDGASVFLGTWLAVLLGARWWRLSTGETPERHFWSPVLRKPALGRENGAREGVSYVIAAGTRPPASVWRPDENFVQAFSSMPRHLAV